MSSYQEHVVRIIAREDSNQMVRIRRSIPKGFVFESPILGLNRSKDQIRRCDKPNQVLSCNEV